MLALAAFAGVLVLIAVLVLQWVSCRGKFIFLDGVVSGRAAIVEPWKRFARPGNSLFAWTILFWITACLAFILAVLPFLPSLRSVWEEREFNWGLIPTFAGLIAILVPLALVAGYILLFLSHFVVPIMYRHGLTATAAWSRFLALLREHVGSFLIYGVLVFLFHVAIFGLVFLVGFSTCCVGFLLFATPYIGEVVLLPVLAWVRALGPEFLAQFGPDFDLFGAAAAPAPAAPATAAQTPAAGPPGGATP